MFSLGASMSFSNMWFGSSGYCAQGIGHLHREVLEEWSIVEWCLVWIDLSLNDLCVWKVHDLCFLKVRVRVHDS